MLLEIPAEVPSTAEHQHPLQYLATLLGGRQCAAGEVLRQCAKAALQLFHLVPRGLMGRIAVEPLLPGQAFGSGRHLGLKLYIPSGSGLKGLAIRVRHYRLAMISEHSVNARIMCFFTVVNDTCSSSAIC